MSKIIKGINDLSTTHPTLFKEISVEKNKDIDIYSLSKGSTKKVWWVCSSCGNEWIATPNHRTGSNSGCPECNRKKISKRMSKRNLVVGKTDFASQRKDLLVEWDYSKNSISPCDVSIGSSKKIWWICSKCGNSFQQSIADRTRKDGKATSCPKCANVRLLETRRTNALKNASLALAVKGRLKNGKSLQNKNNDLLKEWNYEKNYPLTPNDVTYGSNIVVWWKCSKGHEWQSSINTRNRGSGCPVCSNFKLVVGINDLETLRPDIAKEWNYEKNYPLMPKDVIAGGKTKYWWKCANGHEWQAQLYDRVNKNTGCEYCSGRLPTVGVNDFATLYPKMAKQWDYEKNGNKKPQDFTGHSSQKIHWICEKGHTWTTTINSRTSDNTGCPECSKELKTSFPEQAIFYYLSKIFGDICNRDKTSGFEVDILLKNEKIAIEYDGVFWHSNKVKKDNDKNKKLTNLGYKVIRIRENGLECCENAINIFVDNNDRDYSSLDDAICEILKLLNKEKAIVVNIKKDYDEILQQLVTSEKDNSLLAKYPHIAKDWDYEKNGNILPNMIMPTSRKKFIGSVLIVAINGKRWF